MRAGLSFVAACVVMVSAPHAKAEPVSDFEKKIRESAQATANAHPVFHNTYLNKFAKVNFEVRDVQYDVKKTDSLVSPVIGIISFALVSTLSSWHDSQDEASSDNTFEREPSVDRVWLTYTLKDSQWSLKDGKYETDLVPLRGQTFPITTESIQKDPNAVMNSALKFWLP